MLRKLTYCFSLLLLVAMHSHAQDSIVKRIIFIGDAGEINPDQSTLIPDAANFVIANKTTVLFLGDNIYPTGMGLPGSKQAGHTKQILQSQFTPFRNKGAAVYFVPGNHDWDRMGKDGYAKIKEQGKFIAEQHDSLLKLVPENGCVGPYEINVSDSLTIIAFDSEWWLFPHEKETAGCECENKKAFIEKLHELLYRNRYKMILLAAHHPFQSYGHHGGYYSLKDHLFPLTAANKNLYIPLPIFGSLYPLLRSTLQSPEDARHPLYQEMIKQVDGVFKDFPNLLHVAGHEHGLQFIKNSQTQIVSGSGAKEAFVKKGKYSLFASKEHGFVTVDQLLNNDLKITFYTLTDKVITEVFTYTQQYVSLKKMEDAAYNAVATMGDSVLVKANEGYSQVSSIHRKLFGENYRQEWSTATKLPVIKISEIHGGLVPMQRGGGHQSLSLRLKDKSGKEWVLRSVNKYPEILLPPALRETFAKDIVTDAMSAQHPYAALIVPPLAEAAGVPYAKPIIGLVAPDRNLGIYGKDFVNTVCLLEEREPLGKSDNSEKMYKALVDDNDNSFDTTIFFKARLLDLFIGDWDRHEDQWRWAYEKKGKDKKYIAVPRDRDQVLHMVDGMVPNFAARPWVVPMLHDFDGSIKKVNAFFTESNGLNKKFLNQLSHEQWMQLTNEFTAAMTDSLIEKALTLLPKESYNMRHEQLFEQLKERRQHLPAAMEKYYAFLNKIVDIQTTDKNELVQITDAPNNGLLITIHKINKEGKIKDELFRRIFYPNITKEIRLFLEDGHDSVVVNNHANIKLRIVGAKDNKVYNVIESKKTIQLYGREKKVSLLGNGSKLRTHLSNDSANTAYMPTNPYNKIVPMLNLGYNIDDGLMLGAAVKFINQGFRKKPYSSMQQFSFTRSFSTDAFKFKFSSEWLNAVGKADFSIKAKALAPDNTQNFFGLGNNTVYDKTNSIKFYRTRFAIYELAPELRWHSNKTSSYSVSPFLQLYQFDGDDNQGRLINSPSLIHSYDSSTIEKDKSYAGISFHFMEDARNNTLLPSSGGYFSIKVQAFKGLNSYAKDFIQFTPELALFRKLDRRANIVLANRLGAGTILGKAAFYQQLFLGGHENLLGFRQYRFAGRSMLYNNLELRVKLKNIGSYILPGQLGMVAFYDAGKVWAKGFDSNSIHQSVGGGIYFVPAQMAVLQVLAGYSKEGWYPYFTIGFRF
jgi:hypothetical protein